MNTNQNMHPIMESRPPKERDQPPRTAARKSDYKEFLSGNTMPAPHKYVKTAFNTDKPPHFKLAAVPILGKRRREWVEKPVKKVDNGETPRDITFGPNRGSGAGFYDAGGNVVRMGEGNPSWWACEEVAPEAAKCNVRVAPRSECLALANALPLSECLAT